MAQNSGSETAPAPAVPWYVRAVRPFRSLAYPNFRLLWIGNVANSSISWMEMVARNWLVYTLTGSVLAVGAINFARWLPSMVLAVPAGVLSDRVDRRKILLGSQVLILGLYIVLAYLALTGALRAWHLYTIVFLLGTASTTGQPARQSLVAQSVPRAELTNAMSLQQMAYNGTRLGGPTIAGFVMAAWGPAPVFGIIAAAAGIVVFTTYRLHLPSSAIPAATSPFRAATEGLRYVFQTPLLRLLVLLSFFVMFLGAPNTTFLPDFAKKVFQMGPGGFGIMMSVGGFGSLLATFLMASITVKRPVVILTGAVALYGVSLALFAATPWLLPALFFLGVAGLFTGMHGILSNSLLLGQSDSTYHGRIMSLNMLNHSFMPVGALPAGLIADMVGAPVAMAVMASALVAVCVGLAAVHPGAIRLQVAPAPVRRVAPAPAGGSQP